MKIVGNLYYALTHSPEPLSEECLHALSWEAANERFIAAGCISKSEAEEFERIIASEEAGIEVRNKIGSFEGYNVQAKISIQFILHVFSRRSASPL
jgi:hypothetical protein